MKSFCKSLVLPFLVFAILVSMVGCGGGAKQSTDTQGTSGTQSADQTQAGTTAADSKKFDGQTIRFLAPNHNWTDMIKQKLPDFEKNTGVKVNIETYAEDPLTQKLTVELTSGASTIDVFMTRPLQEGRLFTKNKWYETLDEYINDPAKTPADWDWKDFQASYIKTITDFNGKIFAVPIMSDLQILFYRKDLFEANNIQVPTTFEEMEAAAKKLTNTAEEMYGFAARGQRGLAVTQYSTYLYGFGGDFIKDNKSIIDSPEAVEAFKFYGKMLHDYGPPGVTNMSWPQVQAVFGSGKVAMVTDSCLIVPALLDATKFKVSDKMGFAPVPAGPKAQKPYATVPWGLAINSTSTHKDAAWEFIQWLSNKETTKSTSSQGITQCRASMWSDPDVIKSLPEGYAEAVKKTADIGAPYDRPLMTSVVEARDAIGDVLVKSIESGGTADIAALAKDANQKVNELLAKAGEGGK